MNPPSKKRDAPPRARPVLHNGVRYSGETVAAETWGSDPLPPVAHVCVVARDAASDAVLWQAELFEIRYDPDMERDKQEVVITGLALNMFRTRLKATDETGRRWWVDLASHTVSPA